ncbi:MAG: DinB family protein [Streptomycetales bacterium]
MTGISSQRIDPPCVADEHTLLTSFLDFHRATLAIKCDGLTDAALRERSIPPSNLSLLGLVRHLAEVERWWFRAVLAGEDVGQIYCTDDNRDGDFDDVDTAEVAEGFETWGAECDRARRIATSDDLDATGTQPGRDKPFSLRWVLIHMIEEYARHNGHADLLRERIDGAVGE